VELVRRTVVESHADPVDVPGAQPLVDQLKVHLAFLSTKLLPAVPFTFESGSLTSADERAHRNGAIQVGLLPGAIVCRSRD